MTLKEETLNAMKENNKTIDDIAFISVLSKYIFGKKQRLLRIDIDEFFKEAEDDNYYDGFGGVCVDTSLQINFKDNSWLERWKYDGSEGWHYKKPIILPPKEKAKVIKIWDEFFKTDKECD
jgi:hypothetical protein